ncbi:serine/threonine protein kinase [Streptomyces sp. NBC_01142]|uniref:serine/threonine-protein kinase n=1 Tax=Streptomyces sp. NBC_01142 TaxID=2975865 RepID=UPI002253ACDE|nr:serine/threonine-protein kinase [Streptomyces sp. NBC_01142]MCX4826585.1 serine/threonine protein kinase [Streptomyces sp. NBC_01142]
MEDVRELLAEYGQAHSDELSEQDRYRLLVEVVASLIRRTDPDATVAHRSTDEPAVFFELAGRDYAITVTTASGDDAAEAARAAVQARERDLGQGVRWVLVCARAAGQEVDETVRAVLRSQGVFLDRDHLEAAVCDLAQLATLIRAAFRPPRSPHTLLHELLLQEPQEPAPALSLAARPYGAASLPSRTPAGIDLSVVLAGEAWPLRPTGLAWESAEHALITTEAGLADVDLQRGGTRWRLPLPGVHGAAAVLPDGSVWVLCGPAVVMWRDGVLRAAGGGFEANASLLLGPESSVWVLSGSGATLGTGTGSTLALTRLGEEVGDQQRYSIDFDAAVRSAGWLGERRFLLAAGGHSAVVDLAVSTSAGGHEDWMLTPVSYPGHLARSGADAVLVAGRSGSGVGVELHTLDATARTSDAVAELQLGDVLGLVQSPAGGPAYLLGSLPTNDVTAVHPVLVKITGHVPAASPAAEEPAPPAADPYSEVRRQARGIKKDYALEKFPLPDGKGGMGIVHEAVHKETGAVVAFKKPRSLRENLTARMLREIEVAQKLGSNRHVMPVLDSSPRAEWFVMPMAQSTAERLQPELQHDQTALRALVDAVASALTDAHRLDYLHRDIKPANILLLDGRWVLGDWGIVRRPRGQTTNPRRTGTAIGTAEFGAPELSVDPHNATPASDIYSLGKVIGWLLTGLPPEPNVPLLPPGPWRGVVRHCTYRDPRQRPQTIADFLDLVERETAPQIDLPVARAQQLLTAAQEGDTDAARRLLTLAADHGSDYELYLDVLPGLEMDTAAPLLLAHPEQARTLVEAMTGHVRGDGTGWPHWNESKRAIAWLRGVARHAAREEQWDLLEEAARGMCTWDEASNEFDQQIATRDWLRHLRGQAARILAGVLRDHPGSARFYYELAGERAVDMAIRNAVNHATSN